MYEWMSVCAFYVRYKHEAYKNMSKKNAGNTIIEFEEEERKKESGVSFFMKFDNNAPN